MKYTTLVILLNAVLAAGQTVSVLHSFTAGTDGKGPKGALVADAVGNLYGTTEAGGDGGCGTVFEMVAPPRKGGTWTEKVLYSFTGLSDGSNPESGLVIDALGNLYGTTSFGGDMGNTSCTNGNGNLGCGVVFELSPGSSWTETVLYTFEAGSSGAWPQAGLTFDALGNLYGTAEVAGVGSPLSHCVWGNGSEGCGVVFELSPLSGGGWSESTLYAFSGGTDAALPTTAVVLDEAGNVYGVTGAGGAYGGGAVFELTAGTWAEQIIYSLPYMSYPTGTGGGLVFDAAGNLYGTTVAGGESGCRTNGCGAVFELSPVNGEWVETVLYAFTGIKNYGPDSTLVFDAAGNLYGATGGGCGSVYRLTPKEVEASIGWTLYSGKPCLPSAIMLGLFGMGYGTSQDGGTSPNCNIRNKLVGCGTVWGIKP